MRRGKPFRKQPKHSKKKYEDEQVSYSEYLAGFFTQEGWAAYTDLQDLLYNLDYLGVIQFDTHNELEMDEIVINNG